MLRILVVVSLLLAVSATPIESESTSRATRNAVQKFLRSYIDAANRADVPAMMDMVGRRPGVSSVGDGEIERGWDDIRSGNDELVGLEGSYKVSIGSIDVTALGPGYALAVAPFTATVTTDVGTVQVPGAMSVVLEKRKGKWLIVHEHTSTKMQGLAAAEPEATD